MLPASKAQINKAIQECSRELERSPRNTRLRLKLGDLHLRNGDDGKAVKEYLQAAELDAKEEMNTRAIAIYKKVLSLAPDHVEAISRMAALFVKEGLLGDAKGCYAKILKIKPDDREAKEGLSAIERSRHLRDDQTASQVDEVLPAGREDAPPPGSSDETTVSSPDKDLELHYHLGIGYKQMESFHYAIPEFELASKDPSLRFDCYILLGECFKAVGDAEQSKKYFELASKIGKVSEDLQIDG
jgi:tetratricopeptide (TPR) repeat protein